MQNDLIRRKDALRAAEKINKLLAGDFYAHSDGIELINEIPAVTTIHRISKGEFPPDNKYVLIYCGSRPWSDHNDEYGKYWKVAKFVRGISKAERKLLMEKGDWQSIARAHEYRSADEQGNNLVPYYFTEFGPGSYFGQEIDIWAELPKIGGEDHG